MSGANAIHGIILLGAIIVTGQAESTGALVVGLVAIVLAAVNMVGGFVVTDRMLQMFTRKKPKPRRPRPTASGGLMPTWVQLVYLACAVCFILALKGLSGPKTARAGNLLGAAAAVVAFVLPFIYLDLDHVPLILVAIAVGTVGRRRRRAEGADDADAADGGAVQRRRRRRGGAGGAARAARDRAARRTPSAGSSWPRPRSRSWSARSRSPGSIVTFAKLQELMTSRPVVFPGLPVVFGGALLAAIVLSARSRSATGDVDRHRARRWSGLLVGVLLVLPVGGADVPIVISLLNAFTGLTVAAGGYVLSNTVLLVAGTLVGAPVPS